LTADTLPPAPDAYALWQRARTAVTSARYPRRLTYTIAVSGLDGQTPVSDHYRASCDPEDGAIRVFPISDEQLAKPPPVPHGVNASFNIGICFGPCAGIALPLGRPAPYQDLLGEPLLAPTYAFGLRYPSRMPAHDADEPSVLRTIAVVATQTRDYQVTLIDTPDFDGTPTYHLALRPLRHPQDHRLRELWIGTADFLPRRAIVAGNFTVAPLVDVPWTIDFTVLDGAPYVSRESASSTLYLTHRRVVRDAIVAFENISEPTSIYETPLIRPEATETSLVEPGP
jgi:hypothetical protein